MADSVNQKNEDWGDLCPKRAKPHELRYGRDPDGPLVSILLPRFRNSHLRRLAERFEMKPFRLNLDAVGSFVWLRCDGQTPVSTLGEALASEFGEKVEPVEERLTTFLVQLHRGKVIEFHPHVRG